MCGIVGFVGPPDRETLVRMRDALTHRGPDEAGVFEDDRVSLGHRRLSIVDLKSGRQPAFNEDRTVVAAFNGEIYNHPELQPQLEARGHRYRSRCDTETIVHAYEEFGFDCVRRLHGMFAFVVYDISKGVLFGARDRWGKKPLYTAMPNAPAATVPPRFLFASEIKALRKHPACAKTAISERALVDYLLNDCTVGDRSIDSNIRRILPGHAFSLDLNDPAGSLLTWRYWEPALLPSIEPRSEPEAAETVRRLLFEATRVRLMADVPLGCFLSGGIDSASLVAMLRMQMPGERIATFSIGFDEPSFDESAYAERVARHFQTKHHCRRFTARDMMARIERIGDSLDEPFADPSILPVSMLCEFARESVVVALGGDGGDELFAGYDPFRAVQPARWFRRFTTASMRRFAANTLAKRLPASDANMSWGFRLERFLRGVAVDPPFQAPTWMGAFSLAQLADFLPDYRHLLAPELAFADQLAAYERMRAANGSDLDVAIDFFNRFYLPDDILVKVDRASMLHSLEVRSPFLDTALAEYVNRLPADWKLRNGQTKFLLKLAMLDPSAARNWPMLPLPRAIVHRKKKGFGIPVARWIRRELAETFRAALVHEWPKSLRMFNRGAIERTLIEHQSGGCNRYKELWALFMLAIWAPGASSGLLNVRGEKRLNAIWRAAPPSTVRASPTSMKTSSCWPT